MSTDTKQKIIDVAIELFALKGFDGVSVREIAKFAEVNVAALNYHFKSKDNLRQEILNHIVCDFRSKLSDIPDNKNTADYAVKIFEALSVDSARCLNQFKLFLESDYHPCDSDPYPMGHEIFLSHLAQDLNPQVPQAKRDWLINVIISYIVHTAVISSTKMGQKKIDKFMPNKKASLPVYIRELVESLIRDLNNRYPKN